VGLIYRITCGQTIPLGSNLKKRRQMEGRVGEVMGKDIRVRSGLRGGKFVGKRGWGGVLAMLFDLVVK
jgi:hypothetical protein